MPQIWMTYDEIGAMIGCSAYEARVRTIGKLLERRKSRDGNTRVKLDVTWTAVFIAKLRNVDPAIMTLHHAQPNTRKMKLTAS